MLASQVYAVLLMIAFIMALAMLVRHRKAFMRWLLNDKKEVKDRKKWAQRAVEDAQDELKAVLEEEAVQDKEAG